MPGPLHFHWCLKVLIGFALIGHFGLLSFRPDALPTLFSLPDILKHFQACLHTLILARANQYGHTAPVLS